MRNILFNIQSANNPLKKLKIKQRNRFINSDKEFKLIYFASDRNAARTAGIPDKKENRKAVSLSTPRNKRLDMVKPEREIPGIIEIAWVKPNTEASFKFSELISLFPFKNPRVNIRTNPVKIKAILIALIELNRDKKKSLPKIPKIAVIKVTNNMYLNNLGSVNTFIISLKKNKIKAKTVPK